MPAIAAGVKKYNSAFYWHLGDFRAIYKFDEDYAVEPGINRNGKDPTITGYPPLPGMTFFLTRFPLLEICRFT